MAESVFPWAVALPAEQRSAFVDALWGAAAAENDLEALAAVDKVVAEYRPMDAQALPCPMSQRELTVLTGLACGATYAGLGERMALAPATVQRTVVDICRRLDVKSEQEAIEVAARHGWVPALHIPDPAARQTLHGPQAWRRHYRERVAEMRRSVGKPVQLGPYDSHSGAYNAARKINKGLWQEVQPAGAFSADVEPDQHGQWVVMARYLGEPSPATKEA